MPISQNSSDAVITFSKFSDIMAGKFSDRTSTFIVGRNGSGKTFKASKMILEAIALGRQVLVLDYGRSYMDLIDVVGGVGVVLKSDGENSIHVIDKSLGRESFSVFEFEELSRHVFLAIDFEAIAGFAFDWSVTLVVVDESHYIAEKFPFVTEVIANLHRRGASVCVTGQAYAELALFAGLDSSRKEWIHLVDAASSGQV